MSAKFEVAIEDSAVSLALQIESTVEEMGKLIQGIEEELRKVDAYGSPEIFQVGDALVGITYEETTEDFLFEKAAPAVVTAVWKWRNSQNPRTTEELVALVVAHSEVVQKAFGMLTAPAKNPSAGLAWAQKPNK